VPKAALTKGRDDLSPPLPYQGGKRRIAPAILDIIRPDPGEPFWDLCCGAGAVTMEAIRRGHPTYLCVMVDAGPWGEVWRDIGRGTFDLKLLAALLRDVPDPTKDFAKTKEHGVWLSKQPVEAAARPAVYLVLQAGSWGGRAIGWDSALGWRHSGFHPGWTPKPTSISKRPVLPFHPLPATLYERMAALCDLMLGVCGLPTDVRMVYPQRGKAYLDPPYIATADYPAGFLNVEAYARSLPVPSWVSEGRALHEGALRMTSRAGSHIAGGHSAPLDEWLTPFPYPNPTTEG